MTLAQPSNDQTQRLQQLASGQPTLWTNPALADTTLAHGTGETPAVGPAHMLAAEARFGRFAPLLAELFPELQPAGGRIESELLPAPALQAALGMPADFGKLLVKADHGLPVAGSIKARGGIHEVLELA